MVFPVLMLQSVYLLNYFRWLEAAHLEMMMTGEDTRLRLSHRILLAWLLLATD